MSATSLVTWLGEAAAIARLLALAALLNLAGAASAQQAPLPPAQAPIQVPAQQAPVELTTPPELTAPSAPAAPAAPQQTPPASPVTQADISGPIARWDEALTRIENQLADEIRDEQALDRIRSELTRIQDEIAAYIDKQRPRLPDIDARYKALGEAPKEGEPAEPEPVAAQRAELKKALGDITGALKAAEEAALRTTLLNARTRDIRRALFEQKIFERGRSPLSPSLWKDIATDAPVGFERIGHMLSHWWQGPAGQGLFLGFVFAAILVWIALSYAGSRAIRRDRQWSDPEPPSQWRRASSAGRVVALRTLPTAFAGVFLYLAMRGAELLTPVSDRLVTAAIASLVIIATVQGVTKTVLAIQRPHWRLIDLSDKASRKLYIRLMILAALYGIDFFISSVNQAVFMPFAVSVGQSFISSMLFAGLIISILRIKERDPVSRQAKPIGKFYLRLPLWLVAIAILGTALVGYVSLARFIAGQLIVTSTILIIAYLLIIWVNAFGESVGEDNTVAGNWVEQNFGFDARRREQIVLPITLILKAVIVLAAIPFVLLLWGFDWHDISGWTSQILFGFELGGIKVSLITILAALVIFFFGYLAAKFFQAWLDSSVLERAGVDPGVRDSVRTGVGYVGVALAALLAVSYVGLDFSNLAIVAGALSVGVGFGLQSVVNNFVSGLILLAERPVKIGDWIIVGGHEGIVRRISVRSTEIETFDRANVIVPNSMLISDMVKNWTLHNSTGRMPIAVGVHYNSDAEAVRDTLLEVANQHPQVLSTPAPFVFFEGFGASSLDFTLFVYLANVNRSFSVRTDLRLAILKAFREKGIEIPYSQTDVHMRDLDWLKSVIGERLAASAEQRPVTRKDYEAESQAPEDGDNGQ